MYFSGYTSRYLRTVTVYKDLFVKKCRLSTVYVTGSLEVTVNDSMGQTCGKKCDYYQTCRYDQCILHLVFLSKIWQYILDPRLYLYSWNIIRVRYSSGHVRGIPNTTFLFHTIKVFILCLDPPIRVYSRNGKMPTTGTLCTCNSYNFDKICFFLYINRMCRVCFMHICYFKKIINSTFMSLILDSRHYLYSWNYGYRNKD